MVLLYLIISILVFAKRVVHSSFGNSILQIRVCSNPNHKQVDGGFKPLLSGRENERLTECGSCTPQFILQSTFFEDVLYRCDLGRYRRAVCSNLSHISSLALSSKGVEADAIVLMTCDAGLPGRGRNQQCSAQVFPSPYGRTCLLSRDDLRERERSYTGDPMVEVEMTSFC